MVDLSLVSLALIVEDSLESILQGHHCGILAVVEPESVRDHLHRPSLMLCTVLEAEIKVSGTFAIDAESVHRSLGIGFHVGIKPFLCANVSRTLPERFNGISYRCPLYCRLDIVRPP